MSKLKRYSVYVIEVLLVVFFILLLYFTRNVVMNLVPGYYEDREYRDVMADKNDLVVATAVLISDNDTKLEELESLGVSSTEIQQKIEIYMQIEDNIKQVHVNINKMIELNEELKALRLPREAHEYVDLSDDLDQVRKDIADISLDISSANIDSEEFNILLASFRECESSQINWEAGDSEIATQLTTCAAYIPQMQENVIDMEEVHSAELEEMSGYLVLLKAEWDAYIGFYNAAATSDSAAMNSNDAVIQEKMVQINELDLVLVLDEFSREIIEVMESEMAKMSEEEAELSDEWNSWYNDSVD